jgi:replicative DNA helicase
MNTAEELPLEPPPSNTQAEQHVIGTLIADGAAVVRVIEDLSPEDFHHPHYSQIYAAMLALFHGGMHIDFVTVCAELRKRGQYDSLSGAIAELISVGYLPTGLEYHAQMVRDASVMRKLVVIGQQFSQIGQQYKDVGSALEACQSLFSDLSVYRQKKVKQDIGAIALDVFEEICTRYEQKGKLPGTPSGYLDLDKITQGFKPGQMVVLAGRPSMGKSALALCIAYNAVMRDKTPVVFFSIEMTKEQLVERWLSRQTGIPGDDLASGNLTSEQYTKLSAALGELQGLPMYIIDDVADLSAMEAKCKRLQMEGVELGLGILDYMQLVKIERREQRQNEVDDISKGVKALARRLKLPMIALSQVNRACEARQNKRPLPSDLSQSGTIEQDADVVMFVYRDEYYNSESEARGEAEVIVAKNRTGRTGTAHLLYQSSLCSFYDRDPNAPVPIQDAKVPQYRKRKAVGTHASMSADQDEE